MNVMLYGCGTMGQAILKANLDAGVTPDQMHAITASTSSAAFIADRFKVPSGTDPKPLVADADIIILGMKPHQLPACVEAIRDHLAPTTTIISLAAGITCARIEALVPNARVIRAMPNLGARVAQSATAVSLGTHADDEDLAKARMVLTPAGSITLLAESLMDAVIGVAGSGPAWFLTVLEAVIDAGVALGLTYEAATQLASATMGATAALVQSEGIDPGVLRKQACSPGGTTIAGVEALEHHGVRAGVMAAVHAAHDRSQTLG